MLVQSGAVKVLVELSARAHAAATKSQCLAVLVALTADASSKELAAKEGAISALLQACTAATESEEIAPVNKQEHAVKFRPLPNPTTFCIGRRSG